MEPTARDIKRPLPEEYFLITASEQEEESSQRSTVSRRAREVFVTAFRNRFPRESIDLEEGYKELFSSIPEELETHNRPDTNIYSSESSDSSDSVGNQYSVMSNPQPIEMPSPRHHTAPKFSSEQPRELKRFFEHLQIYLDRQELLQMPRRNRKLFIIWT